MDIGGRAEVCDNLNRLVSWAILTETDGVVSRDPDDLVVAEGGEADGTSGIRNEVLNYD